MAQKLEVPIGTKFGRLTTIALPEYKQKTTFKSTYVKVICDCGIEREAQLNCLRNGNTTSCGCYNKEASKKANTTHGLALRHPTWRAWTNMKARCYSVNAPYYKNYGGRGITVCDEWKDDFQSFFDWSIANGWQKGLTIDRKNNNGNYTPDNCRWTTREKQAQNTRRTKLNEAQVLEIRTSFANGQTGRGELANKYNVSRHQINLILRGKSWES